MTAISSIPAWQSSPARSLATTVNRNEAPTVQRTTPSTIVKLSPESATAAIRGGQGGSALAWESKSQDHLTSLIANNFASSSLSGRFGGLGAALLNGFKGEGTDVSQSVQLAPAGQPATPYGIAPTASAPALHGVGDDRISLSITTKSGAQVTLALDNQDNGLALRMSTDGDLSDTERAALAGLAGAFQHAIDGMTQEPPKIQLEGLTQFDPAVLASVDLRAVVRLKTGPESTQSVTFHADGAQRKVSLSGPSGTAEVSVDTSKLAGVGSTEQQAKAMASYLKQFDQAASRGHGDAALMSMFKDAFAGMNSHPGAVQARAGAAGARKWELAAEDHAALTGLADFSASLTQTPNASNPMRPAEQDSFAYQVSQSTSIGGRSEKERSISQQQKSELKASYHTPSIPGTQLKLDHTQASQNYDYHQINDVASSDVDLAYNDGRLVRATLNQSASQSTRVMQYVMGDMVSDTVTPGRQSLQRDLLSVLAPYLSGDPRLSDEQRSDQRKHVLHSLSEQVFLQSYPDPMRGAWSVDKASGAAIQ